MPQSPAFYFDILENLAQGRCPACELVRTKPMHYIDHALYGLVTDPQAQNLFAETGGYCRRHAQMLLQIPWGSALGVAILYRRLVEDAAAELKKGREEGAGKAGAGAHRGLIAGKGKKKSAAGEDNPDCLACKVEMETEQGVLHTLVEMLHAGDGRMTEAFGSSDGFCLFHLERALALSADENVQAALRNHGLRRAEKFLAELSEFIRKSDYRFTEEQIGGEGDSWMRAVAWVTGVSLEKAGRPFASGELKRKMRGEG